jgi:hypothetical protein
LNRLRWEFTRAWYADCKSTSLRSSRPSIFYTKVVQLPSLTPVRSGDIVEKARDLQADRSDTSITLECLLFSEQPTCKGPHRRGSALPRPWEQVSPRCPLGTLFASRDLLQMQCCSSKRKLNKTSPWNRTTSSSIALHRRPKGSTDRLPLYNYHGKTVNKTKSSPCTWLPIVITCLESYILGLVTS